MIEIISLYSLDVKKDGWSLDAVQAEIGQKISLMPLVRNATDQALTLRVYLTWHFPDQSTYQQRSGAVWAGPADSVPLEAEAIIAQMPGNYTVDIEIWDEDMGTVLAKQNGILVAYIPAAQPVPPTVQPAKSGWLPWAVAMGAGGVIIMALVKGYRKGIS